MRDYLDKVWPESSGRCSTCNQMVDTPQHELGCRSTISQVDLPASPEVSELLERLGYLNGIEALRELAKHPWWMQHAAIFHAGRVR